ncbi:MULTISPECIES: hypothetical protein [unclassified Paenibacillus]|uniref:hypothetical protein n=1 Tax=unclassified Paenibacillus TaxID=185978 RepID=UPI003835E1E9
MSRVLSLWFAGFSHQPQGHALERGRLCGGRALPGCLLRKGGDVPGKEVSSANGWLTS